MAFLTVCSGRPFNLARSIFAQLNATFVTIRVVKVEARTRDVTVTASNISTFLLLNFFEGHTAKLYADSNCRRQSMPKS